MPYMNRQAKTFLFRDAVFFSVIQFVIVMCVVWISNNPDDYMWSMLDKHTRVSEINEPKVLLAGGSSVAWGSDSEMISKACNRPVVNLATIAGVGLPFMLNEIRACSKSRDAVVLSLEYGVLLDGGNGRTLFRAFFANPESIRYFAYKDWKTLFDDGVVPGFSIWTKRAVSLCIKATPPSELSLNAYARSAFNEYGDVIRHYSLEPRGYPKHAFGVPRLPEIQPAIERLRVFLQECDQQQISVFYFFPVIPEKIYERKRKEIQEIGIELQKLFAGRVLNSQEEMLYNDSAFFDTHYHLVEWAAKKRTAFLIERLQNRLVSK